jgi:hypothetical protein
MTPSVHKDYSATPLSKKLGAKPGAEVVVLFTTSRAELEGRFEALKRTDEWQAVRFVYGRADR